MRMTQARRTILTHMLAHPEQDYYSYGLVKTLGMESGTVAPILDAFWSAGLMGREWELPESARARGGQRRRMYRLNPDRIPEVRAMVGER
jgi:hypothetical protein